jgi:predicted AAA+ superfamily ATPase
VLLAIDEIQNIPQWSSYVKKLWDEDARSGIDLRVALSGSSSLLLQKGLAESLMGRFEILRSTHWSFSEM